MVGPLNLAFELTRKCSQSAASSGFTKAIVGREPTDKNSTEGYFRCFLPVSAAAAHVGRVEDYLSPPLFAAQ